MIEDVCKDPTKMMMLVIAGNALMALVEYWLGRTDKVEAGSVLEIILIALKGFLKLLFKKK